MASILYLGAALVVVLPLVYMYAAGVVQSSFPKLVNKRICLLIAHPDDEAMFFSPTVLALTKPEAGNHVKILCLSTGNADGLGETRKKELVKSGMSLGLKNEDDVFVLDNQEDFPDSMTVKWDERRVAGILGSAFAPQLARERRDPSACPTAKIDVIVTFDDQGVSSHPNHISLYHGAIAFITELRRGKAEHPSPVALYTLRSTSLLRKYTSMVDAIMTMAQWQKKGDKADGSVGTGHPEGLIFMSALMGAGGLPTAWKAMTEAHKSQMVWFRYLWITFSRYMLVNDLHLQDIEAP